jgi:hypothetical protein
MELIARMHKVIIGNVEKAQQKAKEDLCVVEKGGMCFQVLLLGRIWQR